MSIAARQVDLSALAPRIAAPLLVVDGGRGTGDGGRDVIPGVAAVCGTVMRNLSRAPRDVRGASPDGGRGAVASAELPLLVALSGAGPQLDLGAVGGGRPGHIETEA